MILEGSERTNSETGEVTRYIRALGDFVEYGEVKKSTVDVKVNNKALYEKLLENKNKTVDLDVLVPKPQYPLELADLH